MNKSRVIFILFISFLGASISLNGMPPLLDIFKEDFQKKGEISENQLFLTTMLRCSAASFFMIGGDDPEIKNLGDWFRNAAFGMAVIIEEENEDFFKEPIEIDKENQSLIDEYLENYQIEGFNWYKKEGMPSNPSVEEIFSDFFKQDMSYCVEIYEKFNPDDAEIIND